MRALILVALSGFIMACQDQTPLEPSAQGPEPTVAAQEAMSAGWGVAVWGVVPAARALQGVAMLLLLRREVRL